VKGRHHQPKGWGYEEDPYLAAGKFRVSGGTEA